MNPENILIIFLGYLVGSIPFAYLIAKQAAGIDLNSKGSGNIGARNAYEVTEKKWIGITVLLLDLIKGALPTLLLARSEFSALLPAVVFAIMLGHCYPVWLKFHGGRGLATGAGILLIVAPLFVLLWLVVYWISGKLYDNIHVDTLLAVVLVVAVAVVVPDGFLSRLTLIYSGQPGSALREIVFFIAVAIASRNVVPAWHDLTRESKVT